MSTEQLARAERLIRAIADYPEPGVVFRDITPMLADADAWRATIDALIAPFAGRFDVVAGVEARGFLLAGAVSRAAGVGVVPLRKAGKLPRPAASVSYSLEYGTAVIEAHDDLDPGTTVLLVDDVLATGGTVRASRMLLEQLGVVVVGIAVVLELDALDGRATAGDVHAVFHA